MSKYVDSEVVRLHMMLHGFRSTDMTVTEFVDKLPAEDVQPVREEMEEMHMGCGMGTHEPTGENLLAFAFGEDCEDAWLRKCKYCDKYIALSKGNRRIITEAEAKAIVRAMRKAHTAVKIMTKIIAEVMSNGENKSDHLSD